MSEGTAQRRVGLAQGPGVQRAWPGRPLLGRRTRVLQLLSTWRTKVALRLTDRHYAIYGDLDIKHSHHKTPLYDHIPSLTAPCSWHTTTG